LTDSEVKFIAQCKFSGSYALLTGKQVPFLSEDCTAFIFRVNKMKAE